MHTVNFLQKAQGKISRFSFESCFTDFAAVTKSFSQGTGTEVHFPPRNSTDPGCEIQIQLRGRDFRSGSRSSWDFQIWIVSPSVLWFTVYVLCPPRCTTARTRSCRCPSGSPSLWTTTSWPPSATSRPTPSTPSEWRPTPASGRGPSPTLSR